MSKGDRYYDLMRRLHETVVELIPSLHFDKKHPWHRHLVALYCTMSELVRSACILLRQDAGTGVPILLRSFVEAHVDFLNLAEDRKYGYHLHAAWLKEWIKLFREAGAKSNPFLKGFAEVADRQIVLSKWEDELRELKDKGYVPLSHKEKFIRARLEDVYTSVYNLLCCESHNNIRALTSRHVDLAQDGSDFKVQLFAPVRLDDFVPEMDTFCGILLKATEMIHGLLESGHKEIISTVGQELDELRKMG